VAVAPTDNYSKQLEQFRLSGLGSKNTGVKEETPR